MVSVIYDKATEDLATSLVEPLTSQDRRIERDEFVAAVGALLSESGDGGCTPGDLHSLFDLIDGTGAGTATVEDLVQLLRSPCVQLSSEQTLATPLVYSSNGLYNAGAPDESVEQAGSICDGIQVLRSWMLDQGGCLKT